VTPDDTVFTLKDRINKELELAENSIDIDRGYMPTLRLTYTLQRMNHANGFKEQFSSNEAVDGVLSKDLDQMTLAELGIKNTNECNLSLTCDA